MYWIYDIQPWVLAVGMISSFTFISLLALIVTRGFISRHFDKSYDVDQSVSSIFGAIGMLYGLLLGLVAVAAWENYDKANDLANEEATAIVEVWRDVSVLKHPISNVIIEELKHYTKNIIEVSWPAHKQGLLSSNEDDLATNLHTQLANYELETDAQPVAYAEALSTFSTLIQARRHRLNGVNMGIPYVFWIVIIGGAVLTIPLTFFFHFTCIKTHIIITFFYVFFLSGVIFLIAALDNPFRGEVSVSSLPYQNALNSMTSFAKDNEAPLRK